MVKKVSLFLTFLCLLSSCSTIHYATSTKPVAQVSFSENPNNTQEVSFQIEREFVMWGLIPSHQTIYLDKEIKLQGYETLSQIKINDKRTTGDMLYHLFTFGFYNPRTIIISGFTEK